MFLKIKNQKIHAQYYEQRNASKTLVFLHEALGSVAQWRDFPQKAGILTSCNVLVYDRFGHGLSDPMQEKRGIDYLHKEAWDITPSVFQHFDIKNPILFGHSDGGTIALLYASKFPVHALITEAAHVFVEDITIKGIQQAVLKKDFLTAHLEKYHGKKTEDLFSAWSDTWLDSTFRNWDITAVLPEITCPALTIQGENDEYATAKHLDIIVENIGKNAEKVLISNCRHTPHRDAETLVLETVTTFLKNIV